MTELKMADKKCEICLEDDQAPNLHENELFKHACEKPTNSTNYLLTCFKNMGISKSTSHRSDLSALKTCWFPLFMHSALLVNSSVLVASIKSKLWDTKIGLACASTNVLSIAAWHYMHHNKHKLEAVIQAFESDVVTKLESAVLKVVNAVFLAVPSVYSLVCTLYSFGSAEPTVWLFGYSAESSSPYGYIVLFLNVNSYVSLQVIFPAVSTSAYCFLCHIAHKRLTQFQTKIGPLDSNQPAKSLVQEYFRILSSVERIESTFSVPVFLILFMHVMHIFSLLASCLTNSEKQFTTPFVAEVLTILLTSVFTTVAVVVCASRLLGRMDGLTSSWKRRREETVLEKERDVKTVMKLAVERGEVPMTACNIVTLRNRFIFSLFGALLTYGLLVIQINK